MKFPNIVASNDRAAPKGTNTSPSQAAVEQELRAMRVCHAELDHLAPEVKVRVLVWLATVCEIEVIRRDVT